MILQHLRILGRPQPTNIVRFGTTDFHAMLISFVVTHPQTGNELLPKHDLYQEKRRPLPKLFRIEVCLVTKT